MAADGMRLSCNSFTKCVRGTRETRGRQNQRLRAVLTATRVQRGAEGGRRFISPSQGGDLTRRKRVRHVKEMVNVARSNDREIQALMPRLVRLSA